MNQADIRATTTAAELKATTVTTATAAGLFEQQLSQIRYFKYI